MDAPGALPNVLGKPASQGDGAEEDGASLSVLQEFVAARVEADLQPPVLEFFAAQGLSSVEELAALTPEDLASSFSQALPLGPRSAIRRLVEEAGEASRQGRQPQVVVNGGADHPQGADLSEAEVSDEDAPLFGSGDQPQSAPSSKAAAGTDASCGRALLACTTLITLIALGAMIALRVAMPRSLFRDTRWERAPSEAFGASSGGANIGRASPSGLVPGRGSGQIHNLDVSGGHAERTSSLSSAQDSVQPIASGASGASELPSHADVAPTSDRESLGIASVGQQTSEEVSSQAKASSPVVAQSSETTLDVSSQADAPKQVLAKGSDTSYAAQSQAALSQLSQVCTPPPSFPRHGSSGCQSPPIPSVRRLDSRGQWPEEGTVSINGNLSAPRWHGPGSLGAPTAAPAAEQRLLMAGEGEKWLEDIIAGRGPYADEIKKCAQDSRRRQSRRLRSSSASAATAAISSEEDALSEALVEAGGPPLERRLEEKGWYSLAGREFMVAENEGAELGHQGKTTLEQCQSRCRATERCNSIAYCAGDSVCWLKGGSFQGNEDIRPHQACTTHYWGFKFNGPPRPTPRPEEPQEPPPRKWCALPSGQDVERYLTTWKCIDAFGSQVEARRKACFFRNLYYEGFGHEGDFVAHIVKGCIGGPSRAELEKAHISIGVGSGFNDVPPRLRVEEHASLQDFERKLAKGQNRKIVEQGGLTLAFGPVYHFNIGHGLWDGLYPAFVSLKQFGLQDTPFRAFVLSGWLSDVERQVPGMYAKVEDTFSSIGGLGLLTRVYAGFGATRAVPVVHRFEELVMGVGTNAQKLDMNPNMALGACRELDACRAYRQRIFNFHGVPLPASVRRSGPFRAIMIENKRYSDLEEVTEELQKATRPGGPLEDFQINWVKWSPSKSGSKSMQTGNFTRHLEILSETEVHISAPGTGQMYQTFLPDGAIHINLGENREKHQGYMEEYMAEGAPYLRALYYPKREPGPTLKVDKLIKLLERARQLLQKGLEGPPPVGSNLSPVGKVFKAYCYWAHREKFGLDALSKGHIMLRELRGETWTGNSFPEDLVYSGAPNEPGSPFKPDSCLIGALRASFDQSHPELGPGNRGWFGTAGKWKPGR